MADDKDDNASKDNTRVKSDDAQVRNEINAIKAQLSAARTPGEVQRLGIAAASLPQTNNPELDKIISSLKESIDRKEQNLSQTISSSINAENLENARSMQEIASLKEVGVSLEKEFPAFEKLSNKYIEEQQEELKKSKAFRESVEDRLKNGQPMPQAELDAQLKTPEQIDKEREKVKNIRDYHKKVTDHHDNLSNKIGELEKNLEQKDLSQERRAELTKQLNEAKAEHTKHAEIKTKADKQVEKIENINSKKREEVKKLHKIADDLPDKHPEKVKLKKFAQSKEEEHNKIINNTELPKNLERTETIKKDEVKEDVATTKDKTPPKNLEKTESPKKDNVKEIGDDIKKNLPKNITVKSPGKIDPPLPTPQKGGIAPKSQGRS